MLSDARQPFAAAGCRCRSRAARTAASRARCAAARRAPPRACAMRLRWRASAAPPTGLAQWHCADQFVAGAEGMRPARGPGGTCRSPWRRPRRRSRRRPRNSSDRPARPPSAAERDQAHGVGMLGQDWSPTKAMSRTGRSRSHAGRSSISSAERRSASRRGRTVAGLDRVRRLAEQAEDHAEVGRMAVASGAERAVQLAPAPRALREQPLARQRVRRTSARAAHRPDRVRARRPDADLEDVEDGQHRPTMQPAAAA